MPGQTILSNQQTPNYHTSCWTLIAVAIFTLSLTATAYFGLQLRRSEPTPLANYLAADKGYGVTTDLTQYNEVDLQENLSLMYEHGFTWIRQPIPWHEIESERGQHNWQPYDRIIQAVADFNANLPKANHQHKQLHLKLIAVLHTTPHWARPPNSSETTPPNETHDFGTFAYRFAERYGNQINHYQIWHEPNIAVNWGDQYVNPAGYTHLLREATVNIRAVDNEAVIITAGLAPTLEDGPLNLNEMAYLDQMYQARANRWFDVVSTQIYGFATEPSQPADPQILGFNRTELLHQVMLNHKDTETPMWATAFGWAVFDDDWTGRKSLWKQAIPAVQTQRTANAILHVRRHWPWLGPMFAIRWDTADLASNDPAFAHALTEHPEILGAFQTMSSSVQVATIGHYPAHHLTGRYSNAWRFSEGLDLADIPQNEPRRLKIAFEGTRFDLTVHRGPYRGYLWVTIDKDEAALQYGDTFPANALPQDRADNSYVVLYDPLYGSETVTLARHLEPGYHEVEIVADGGWGQWAIGGWTVYNEPDTRPLYGGLIVSGLLAVVSSLPTFWLLFQTWLGLAKSVWAWSESVIAKYATLGNNIHVALTFGLGIALYLSPEWLALAILPLLAIVILLRPDLGLALIVASLSFFQYPVDLPFKDFSPVEFTLALTLFGLLGRGLIVIGRRRYATEAWAQGMSLTYPMQKLQWPKLTSLDYAALALVILALIATLNAPNFGVSMMEWRRIVLESVIFYFLIRVGLDFTPTKQTAHYQDTNSSFPLSLIYALIAGATAQSLIALYLYFFTDTSITAEGVHRALGLAYGSPNNLALFLERVWPIVAVLFIMAGKATHSQMRSESKTARWRFSWSGLKGYTSAIIYGFCLLIISLTIFLTFSKGAILVGLPLAISLMCGFYLIQHRGKHWQWIGLVTIIGLTILLLSLIPLSQTERFNTIFDVSRGTTTFVRVKLWEASLSMMQDHWLLGLGLDNFLYEYRTRYILPAGFDEPNLNHPHNLILDFGLRLGVGGILVLLWLQWGFWRAAWRLYRQHNTPLVLGFMGSMLTFIGHGLVDNSYFLVDLAFVFFLTVGIVQRIDLE